jgi:hypothetical protein
MTDFLIRRGLRHTVHIEKYTQRRQRHKLECWWIKLKNTKDFWEPTKARKR